MTVNRQAGKLVTGIGLSLFANAELLPHKRDYGLGCVDGLFSLFFGVRLKRHGGRSEGVRIACGNIILIQDSARRDVAREIFVYGNNPRATAPPSEWERTAVLEQ
jgi:hypothetical protein